jgi:hypothetical protein
MPRKLTRLRIDEVSSVDKGAGEGVKIILMKRDNGDDTRQGMLLFNDIMHKADVPDPLRGPRDEPDDKKLSDKLDEIVAEMIVAAPSLHPQRARRWLLHTESGRALLAQHATKKELPTLNKGNTPMTERVDIFKLSNIDSVVEISKSIINETSEVSEFDFTKILMGHAKQSKRSLESILTDPATPEIQQAYALAKGYRPGAAV